uniref:Cytochrome P450 n=1 Tax=Bionectria ochroleuca TaxID=29856 RepID=A0A8H7TJW7_BIOOC
MPSISSTAAAVTVGLTGIWVICSSLFLLRNYIKARAIGVPIRVIPVSHSNPFWMLMDRPVLGVLRRFGLESTSFARYGFRLWEIEDRAKSHQEMGPAFILVTPDRNWLYIADPDTINEVFRRRTDFPRCVELTEVLDVFGPSIATAEGARWKVQRKIVTSCFTEPTNEIVWSESLWLAKDMLQYWTSKPSLATTARDCRTLSLNVLSRAGFGKSFKFEGQEEQTSSSETYQGSLQMILENCFLIFAFGTKALGNPWLPEKLNKVHKACEAFQNYMTTMYEEAKGADNSTSKNFIASLVRASQREDEHALTEKELYGNMFTFNFAGHDTTAHTFTFALYFLAAHPDVQAWINEEIREVFKDEDCSYTRDFPRLKRCLALMLETLRLYTPVPVAKWTESQEQSLNVGGGKTVVIPQIQWSFHPTQLFRVSRITGPMTLWSGDCHGGLSLHRTQSHDQARKSSSTGARGRSSAGLTARVTAQAASSPKWSLLRPWRRCFGIGVLIRFWNMERRWRAHKRE